MTVDRIDLEIELDAFVERARNEKPEPLRSMDARRMVRSAVEQALTKRKTNMRRFAFAAAAVLLLGFATAAHVLFGQRVTSVEVGRGDRPLRLALRSGDTLVAAPSTELEILAQESQARSVRVTHGTALFDVQKLRDGERFEVDTEHAHLRVLGTVFAVEVENGRTIVRVYEGRVFVSGRVIQAGGVWVSAGLAPEFSAGALSVEAAEAVASRQPASPKVRPAQTEPAVIAAPLAQPAPRTLTVQSAPSVAVGKAVTPEQGQALLAEGDAEGALALAERHASEGSGFALLAADALQALGRFAAAAQRYEQAADALTDERRERAALSAASLTLLQEHDAARALSLLDRFALDDQRSSVRERATVLRVDALLALGQRDAARVHALRYLDREPETQTSARMRSLIE
jgi:hypothetical protein